jgi:hypothetical protein
MLTSARHCASAASMVISVEEPPATNTTGCVGVQLAPAILLLTAFGARYGPAGVASWVTAERAVDTWSWSLELLGTAALALWARCALRDAIEVGQHGRSANLNLTRPFGSTTVAFVSISGIILVEDWLGLHTEAAHWLIIVFSILLALIGERLTGQWISDCTRTSRIPSAYFMPLVVSPFVISMVMNGLGAHLIAMGIFGAGASFWAVMGAVVIARSLCSDGKPTDQLPLHAALLAAPAISCVAWMDMNSGTGDLLGELFTGVLAAMVLVQIMVLKRYATLAGYR